METGLRFTKKRLRQSPMRKSRRTWMKQEQRHRGRSRGWADEAREFVDCGFAGGYANGDACAKSEPDFHSECDGADRDAWKYRARFNFDSRRKNRGGGSGSEGAGRRDGDRC